MNIVFLSSLYPPHTKGGGELSTHYIARGLVKRGHRVTVIAASEKRAESTLDGVQVVRIPAALTAKPLFEQQHSQKMARLLKDVIGDVAQWDIIHAHDFRTALALSELHLPNAVVTARDYAQICGSTNNVAVDGSPCPGCDWRHVWQNHRVAEASFPRKLFRAWQFAYNIDYRTQAFRQFPTQIFISNAQRHEIASQQDLSTTKTYVIYNPVGDEYFTTPLAIKTSQDLLYVGTVEWYKGVELLLRAFHALSQQFPHLQLTIVGEGAQKQQYEQLVASWGLQYRVKFTGKVPYQKLMQYYDAADIVVAPHLWTEPFGRTVVEAMARSRIVVAANVGGPAEIIQDNKTGLLFKKGSLEDLLQKLTQAITLRDIDHREMQTAASTWTTQHLTEEAIAQQYEAIYQDVQNGSTKP